VNILVTGATGFLGKKVCLQLIRLGHQVTGIGRNQKIGGELEQQGVAFIKADLRDKQLMINSCQGIDVVIHSGALSSPWGKYQTFYETNVVGTKNIIAGCQQNQVKRLVHISTPSVYFDFKDRFNVKESDQLASPAPCHYTHTKLLAEGEVEKAYRRGLATITLRPRGLFGPGDTSIIPRLIKAFENGRLPIIGDGKNIIDLTYIDNVVDAVILSINSGDHTFGQKYNITNDEPIVLWKFIDRVLSGLGYEFKGKKIPFPIIYSISSISELICKYILRNKEPTLTRYTAGLLAKSQTLDISKAKFDLGYHPKVSMEHGLKNIIEWWKQENAS